MIVVLLAVVFLACAFTPKAHAQYYRPAMQPRAAMAPRPMPYNIGPPANVLAERLRGGQDPECFRPDPDPTEYARAGCRGGMNQGRQGYGGGYPPQNYGGGQRQGGFGGGYGQGQQWGGGYVIHRRIVHTHCESTDPHGCPQ